MSTSAKLKKQAQQYEHDRQYDKALTLYERLLDGEPAAGDDEVDVGLFNRAGDLALRAGDSRRAVTYYERAVDRYAAGGLLNNAIALCSKILRHAPDRVATHYTLGVLHGKQGFRGDAKHHFVVYADHMHRAGRDDEALRALREFVELCSPGADVRALLAQYVARSGRDANADASALQTVLDGATARAAAAAAAAAASAPPPAQTVSDMGSVREADRALVFLDLTGGAAASEPDAAAPAAPVPDLLAGYDLPEQDAQPEEGVELDLLGVPSEAPDPGDEVPVVVGLESTSWEPADEPLTADLPSASGSAARVHATELPGELPPLEFPIRLAASAAAESATAVARAGDPPAFEPGVENFLPPSAARSTDVLRGDDDGPDGGPALDFVFEPEPDVAGPPDAEPFAVTADLADDPRPAFSAEAPAVARVAPGADVSVLATVPRTADAQEYVDLGDWLRELEAPRTTRMVTAEAPQSGDEAADFERMLDAFKAGVERNIDDADFDSHYDLGVAFREMGLLEEAVVEFQRAARAPGRPLRAVEALGQCFVDLGQPELALEALARAVDDPGARAPARDEQLVGVLYLLAVANEQTHRQDAAAAYYRRVLATDLQFRDAGRRLAQLSPPTR